jgi:hypothetical protein
MAKACYAADMQGAPRPYCETVFQAVFVGNERIDAQTCVEIASRIKLDARLFGMPSGPANPRNLYSRPYHFLRNLLTGHRRLCLRKKS